MKRVVECVIKHVFGLTLGLKVSQVSCVPGSEGFDQHVGLMATAIQIVTSAREDKYQEEKLRGTCHLLEGGAQDLGLLWFA